MSGILVTLLSALVISLADTFKKKLSGSVHSYVIIWTHTGVAVIVNWLFLYLTSAEHFDFISLLPTLIPCLAMVVFCEILFMRGITAGDFSLARPFLAFIPVFTLFVSNAVFNERPSAMALLGVVAIVLGAYMLSADSTKKENLLAPLLSLAKNPASRIMILNSAIMSLVVTIQRLGNVSSAPLLFVTLIITGEFLVFSILIALKGLNPVSSIKSAPMLSLSMGCLWAIGISLMYVGMNLTLLVYATAVHQSAMIFSMFFAHYLLGEDSFKKRLECAAIMFIGVLLITFGSG